MSDKGKMMENDVSKDLDSSRGGDDLTKSQDKAKDSRSGIDADSVAGLGDEKLRFDSLKRQVKALENRHEITKELVQRGVRPERIEHALKMASAVETGDDDDAKQIADRIMSQVPEFFARGGTGRINVDSGGFSRDDPNSISAAKSRGDVAGMLRILRK